MKLVNHFILLKSVKSLLQICQTKKLGQPTFFFSTKKLLWSSRWPRMAKPFRTQAITILKKFRSVRYEGLFTPPDLKGTLSLPATRGWSLVGRAAYDPNTGYLYIGNNLPEIITHCGISTTWSCSPWQFDFLKQVEPSIWNIVQCVTVARKKVPQRSHP